jgi:hypothetical protein
VQSYCKQREIQNNYQRFCFNFRSIAKLKGQAMDKEKAEK